MRTLLIGMGNPILRDDAIGVRLAADIARRLADRPGLDVYADCSAGGLELLPVVEGYDRLIVIDSIKTRGGTPGTWYRFTAADLRPTWHLTNIHDTNLATALELGRRSGQHVPDPESSYIFAVEILDNMTFDEELSPPLAQAYAGCLEDLVAEIEAILAS